MQKDGGEEKEAALDAEREAALDALEIAKLAAALAERHACPRRKERNYMLLRFTPALSLLAFSVLRADVMPLFSDFGAGNSYDAYVGQTISTDTSIARGFNVPAMSFIPAYTRAFAQIDVAIGYVAGTNSVELTLNSDNAGLPGATLETWNLNELPQFGFGNCCGVETVFPDHPLPLHAGERYWLIAFPGGPDTVAAWNLNDIGLIGLDAFEGRDGNFYPADTSVGNNPTLGAFDVLPVPVPDPSSATTLGSILALLAILLV